MRFPRRPVPPVTKTGPLTTCGSNGSYALLLDTQLTRERPLTARLWTESGRQSTQSGQLLLKPAILRWTPEPLFVFVPFHPLHGGFHLSEEPGRRHCPTDEQTHSHRCGSDRQ